MHKHKAVVPLSLQWPRAAIETRNKTLYGETAETKTGGCLHIACVCVRVSVSGLYDCLVQTLGGITSCAYTAPCSKINTLLHFINTVSIQNEVGCGFPCSYWNLMAGQQTDRFSKMILI